MPPIDTLAVASFLPDVELPVAGSRARVPLRPSGLKTTVVFSMHAAGCAGCQEYLDRLAGSAAEFDVWDGRLIVIAPGGAADAARVRTAFGKVLADEALQVARPGSASVIVADRYGQVFSAAHAAATHDLPGPREIEEWLKFLGTLCPE